MSQKKKKRNPFLYALGVIFMIVYAILNHLRLANKLKKPDYSNSKSIWEYKETGIVPMKTRIHSFKPTGKDTLGLPLYKGEFVTNVPFKKFDQLNNLFMLLTFNLDTNDSEKYEMVKIDSGYLSYQYYQYIDTLDQYEKLEGDSTLFIKNVTPKEQKQVNIYVQQ